MVRDPVFDIELAEPPVGQVKLDFLGEPALGADAIAVADDEHPDHELRIDRGAADVAVMRLQFHVEVRKRSRRNDVDPSQKVVLRDAVFEAELVEQLGLITLSPTHHRRALRRR